MLDTLKASGMRVTEFAPDEAAKLRERAKPVIAKYTKDLGETFVGEMYAAIDKVRSKA